MLTPTAPAPPTPPAPPAPTESPRRTASANLPRRYGVILAIVPVLAVGLADAVVAVRSATPTRTHAVHATPGPHPTVNAQVRSAALRALAVRDLLARRGDAVLHHNLPEFLSTVDPAQPAFVKEQRREFTNMARVPFAAWSYDVNGDGSMPLNMQALRYGVTVWAPQAFTLHYEIRGFDVQPTSLTQYPTFVQRGGHWYIASFDDFNTPGQRSDVDIWDFGPVRVARAPGVLVLGHPSSTSLMQTVAQQASAAIPRVNAVWGRDWPRRVVVLVPSSQKELAQLVDDSGDLSQIAAVASAEVQDCPGPPDPVGGRVGINPANWNKLSTLGQRIVLTHELTHVATRSDTGSCTPTWLVEGFADYVGYLDSGVPVSVIAQELGHDVRAGRAPHALPPDSQFAGSSPRLAQAYEGGWMACRLIASRWGASTLVRFYRAVGTSALTPSDAVASAMTSLLHVTPSRFVALWRAYLRAQLS